VRTLTSPSFDTDLVRLIPCNFLHLRYHKYNLVLRSFSGVAFLKQQFERDCMGNLYPTTIHCINSAVIKLSKLQVACPVYRGSTRAVLPSEFWQVDEYGLSGGVEFGFTSTTTDREQAVHYAQGKASLIFESQMGLIDRGADLTWLSQYPHEREVLFGPLLGQQPLTTWVERNTLVVATRMSACR
jgi:NLR family CARD domain-containing protein 3